MSAEFHDEAVQLDRYLDNLLTPEERAAFERKLQSDPALRAAIELQQRCDRALRSVAAAPEVSQVLAGVQAPAARRGGSVFRIARMAVAAVLLIAVSLGGAWAIVSWQDSREQSQKYAMNVNGPRRTLDQAYAAREAGNFAVDWVCKTDREFADTFRQRFGQALLVTAQLPSDVRVNGLCYENVLSPRTTLLVARAEGKGVIVFVDLKDRCAPPGAAVRDGLHAFRREIGKLCLIEVTPLDHPRMLDLVFDPDAR